MVATPERQRWLVAASLFIALFFLWGTFNTSPIFVGALLKSFHWSHARVAWIPSILALAVGCTAPLAGWLLNRLEAPLVMTTGAILAAAGLIAAWPLAHLQQPVPLNDSVRHRAGRLDLAASLATL